MMAGTDIPVGKSARERPRSLLIDEWPDADRRAWEDACRPRSRLKPGGSASYLAPVSRDSSQAVPTVASEPPQRWMFPVTAPA